jgi:DNA-binding GntR family transcriptional regulator
MIKKNSNSKVRKPWRPNFTNLTNEIVDQIETGILFGDFKPREHLVQDQIAEKYGAERNVIRAALKRLEEKSVIEHFPNRGSVVKEFTAKNAKDLYQVRFFMEGMAAEMAVTRIRGAKIRELESLSGEMERNLEEGNFKGFTLAHEKFHQVIFEAADNFYLLKMIKELRSASASIRNFSYSRYSLPEIKNHLFDEHKQMVLHLKKKDVRRMGKISRQHIRAGINYYLRNLFPQESQLE